MTTANSGPAAAAAPPDLPFGQGSETCCADCGSSQVVTWCPLWALFLCYTHREQRTDKELRRAPVPAGQPVWRLAPPL